MPERETVSLAVVGSRTFNDRPILEWVLSKYRDQYNIERVVSGGAVGADTMAVDWANLNQIPALVLLPDYTRHGRSAPFVRNEEIVKRATRLVAFYPSRERTAGTAHSVKQARLRGIPVEEVFVDEAMRDAFMDRTNAPAQED